MSLETLDWRCIEGDLDAFGCAATGPILSPQQCAMLRAAYDEDALYRSRVVMSRHGYGRVEYRYFAYPLPDLVADLRAAF